MKPEVPATRQAVLRLVVLLGAVALLLLVVRFSPVADLLERERLMQATGALRELPGAAFLLIAAVALLAGAGVPVTLLMLVPGAVLGGYQGFLVSWAGIVLAATLLFFTGRALAAPLVQRLLGKRRARFERALKRRGFWPLILLRYVPIPFSVCNLATGSAGVPLHLAVLSSAVGYAPVAAVWTFLATALVSQDASERALAIRWAIVATLVVAALSATPVILSHRSRRRKLADLRQTRQREERFRGARRGRDRQI